MRMRPWKKKNEMEKVKKMKMELREFGEERESKSGRMCQNEVSWD